MSSRIDQRFAAWEPAEAVGKTPSFGEFELESVDCRTLCVTLPYEEGKLRLRFNEVRSFMTSWDGDPNPYLTWEESGARPGNLVTVEGSRWLESGFFTLEIDSVAASALPWKHFWIVANYRSIHIAARDDIDAEWLGGSWSGGPGVWRFTPDR